MITFWEDSTEIEQAERNQKLIEQVQTYVLSSNISIRNLTRMSLLANKTSRIISH